MKFPILQLLALMSCTSCLWASVDELVAQSRGYLSQRNPVEARIRAEQALAIDPSNVQANVLVAVTRLLTLAETPDGKTILDRLGMDPLGRNIHDWSSGQLDGPDGKPTMDPSMNGRDLADFVQLRLIPALRASEANLANITNPSAEFVVTAKESNGSTAVLDQGDFLLTRALLNALQFFLHSLTAHNLDVQLAAVAKFLDEPQADFHVFLQEHPDLLTFESIERRLGARAAFLAAIDRYLEASAFIRGRTDTQLRLFNLDAEALEEESRFAALLGQMREATKGPVVLKAGKEEVLDLRPYFEGVFAFRNLMPQMPHGELTVTSFSDPSFGGMLAGVTTEQVNEFVSGQFGVSLAPEVSARRLASGLLELQFETTPHKGYVIEQSQNLRNWTQMDSFLATTNRHSFVVGATQPQFANYFRLRSLDTSTQYRGRIMDFCDLTPIANATVVANFDHLPATTDLNGNYTLQARGNSAAPSWGRFEISVERAGFGSVDDFAIFPSDFGDKFVSLETVYLVGLAQAAPANDDFANRSLLAGRDPKLPYSLCGATVEPFEEDLIQGFLVPQGSIWYEYASMSDEWVQISLMSPGNPAHQPREDWELMLYEEDPSGNIHPTFPRNPFEARAGHTYYLQLLAHPFTSPSSGMIQLRQDVEIDARVAILEPTPDISPSVGEDVPVVVEWESATEPLHQMRVRLDDAEWVLTNSPARLSWKAVSAGWHSIEVRAIGVYGTPAFSFSDFKATPVNYRFDRSKTLTGVKETVVDSNEGTDLQHWEPNPGPLFRNRTVWWKWTAPHSGTFTLSTVGDQSCSSLLVYEGDSITDLTQIDSLSGGSHSEGATVTFAAVGGDTYHVAVAGPKVGRFQLSLNPGAAPSVSMSIVQNPQWMRGQPLQIKVSFEDPDGLVESISLADGNGVVANVRVGGESSGTITIEHTPRTSGPNFVFTATAMDNTGLLGLRQATLSPLSN